MVGTKNYKLMHGVNFKYKKTIPKNDDEYINLDSYNMLMKEITKYKELPNEKQLELLRRYKNENDTYARELLVLHNGRLLLKCLKKKCGYLNKEQLLDYFQDCRIILLKAIEGYNLEKGVKFSTYATQAIINHLLQKEENIIDCSYNKKLLVKQYIMFTRHYLSTNGIFPTDDEIMEKLKISKKLYKDLMEYITNKRNLKSLNEKMDDEKSEIEEFIDNKDNSLNIALGNLDDKILLYKLKQNLSPVDYYILFYTVLTENNNHLYEIGDIIGLTDERVRQRQSKIFKEIKRRKLIEKKVDKKLSDIEDYNILPIDYKSKVILLWLRDKVSNDEYLYYYYYLFEGLRDDKLREKLESEGIDFEKIKKEKNPNLLNIDKYTYAEILASVLSMYSINEIFEIDLKSNENYKKINNIINELSYEDIVKIITLSNIKLDKSAENRLKEYFDCNFKSVSGINAINTRINLTKFRYKGEKHLNKNKLYKTYLKHKDIFEPEYQEYLEGTLFSEITKKKVSFNRTLACRKEYTIIRLEELYYKIDKVLKMEIPESEFIKTVIDNKYLYNDEELKILDSVYDIFEEKTADRKESPDPSKIEYLYDKTLNINLGVMVKNVLENEDIITKYLNDPYFNISNKDICKLRYIDYMTQEEIASIYKLTKQQVSGKIVKCTHNILFYHYNLLGETRYEPEKIEEILIHYKYSELEKSLLRDIKIYNLDYTVIAKKYKLTNKEITKFLTKFNTRYLNYFGKGKILEENIVKELNYHITDTVLNEQEIKILSLYYGIKTVHNPIPKKLSLEEIAKQFNLTIENLKNKIRNAQIKINLRNKKIIFPELGAISREELIILLQDKNLPITIEEKELICKVKGIGLETKTIEELSEELNINLFSVKRRLLNSFLKIKQYQEKRKSKKYDYELDIKKYLRYFPLYEQRILTYLYKDNLSKDEIAKIFNLTYDQIKVTVFELNRKLKYYEKYPNKRTFDYDYLRDNYRKDDFPFYGNKDFGIKIFNRLTGNDGFPPVRPNDLVKEMNISKNLKTNYIVRSIIVSCYLYKDGYKRVKEISISKLEDFYQRNKDKLSSKLKDSLERSIKNISEINPLVSNSVNDDILFEVIKEEHDTIDIKTMNRQDVIKLLRDNQYNLTKSQLEIIRNYRKIPKRDIMNGKEKMKVIRLISRILKKYNSLHNKPYELKKVNS